MRFLYEEPGWFWRDCEVCQTWLIHNNEVMRDAKGKPVKNPVPPKCHQTPCWHKIHGRLRLRFTVEDLALYRRWQVGRVFHALPLPGGIVDQNWLDMEKIRLLESYEQIEERKSGYWLMRALRIGR